MDKAKAERWSGQEPPMLDHVASLARTALDDPGALDVWTDLEEERKLFVKMGERSYVIEKLDEIMGLLNPAMETTAEVRTSLTVLGRHIADRVELMESLMQDDGEAVWNDAIESCSAALDYIDQAINYLTPEEDR